MAQSAHRAVDTAGRRRNGRTEAASEGAAIVALERNGLLVVDVKPARADAEGVLRWSGQRPAVLELTRALTLHLERENELRARLISLSIYPALLELMGAHAAPHIVAYGASLDPAYVEAVDDLIDDAFLRTFTELSAGGVDARGWRIRMNAARAQREAHFARLVRLLELHNALARQAGKVRATWSAPRSGVLGLNLAPDHDLKVNTRIEPEQWQAAPPAGSLRGDTARG